MRNKSQFKQPAYEFAVHFSNYYKMDLHEIFTSDGNFYGKADRLAEIIANKYGLDLESFLLYLRKPKKRELKFELFLGELGDFQRWIEEREWHEKNQSRKSARLNQRNTRI